MLPRFARAVMSLALFAICLSLGSGHVAARPALAGGALQIFTGRAPNVGVPTDGSSPTRPALLSGAAAFAVQLYPDEYLRYIPNTGTPGDWMEVAGTTDTAYYAGDFVGRHYDRIYVIDYTLNELHTLAAATGADTTIGACTPMSGQVWTGATGTADGTLYASSTDGSTSHLYTVNVATGAATVVGQITNAPGIIDIAIDTDGEMYGVDVLTDMLVQINPASGAGTVVGPIGFDAHYAQGMDFEDGSGVLYLAAYNQTSAQGELRIADTTTGSSTLVGAFSGGAQVDVLAFTPPTDAPLQNAGFEDGWTYWTADGSPYLSGDSHGGSWSMSLGGEEAWVWQEVVIPPDALEIVFGYWFTGLSSDPDWDNDILCGGIWDLNRQTEYATVCYGLTYFYSSPKEWKYRVARLSASELASVAGRRVVVAFRITQDWLPGYHKTSTAWVDDAVLYVTRPIYDYAIYAPLVVR